MTTYFLRITSISWLIRFSYRTTASNMNAEQFLSFTFNLRYRFAFRVFCLFYFSAHTGDRARLQNASSAMSLGAPFSSSVNCNNTNYTSEYSEIPSYSTCREAVERCNYTGLSNTAPAYLSMSQNSSTSRSSSRRDPSRNQSCQNNIYMEPYDNEEEEEPSSRYSVVLRSPKSEQTKDICREKERWNSKSPPASTGNREERENMEQRGNLKCSFTGSKVQESSDYLEPFDIQ